MTRVPDVAESEMSLAQQAVYDRIRSGPRGRVEGPLRVWLHSPELADRSQALGEFCRYRSALAPRLREFVILLIAAEWRAGFEWTSHAPLARSAGLDEAVLTGILQGDGSVPLDPELSAARAFVLDLIRTRDVAAAVFERALEMLGAARLVELVGLVGYYSYIAMTIRAFRVATDNDPFER